MFFTNIQGLSQELKANTVSHVATIAYSVLTLLLIMPWSLIIYFFRANLTPQMAQMTFMSALMGSIAQYVGVILAVLQFLYYIRQVRTQGNLVSFTSLYWVVAVRYFLRTAALFVVLALAIFLSLKFNIIPKADLGRLVFGIVFNPHLMLIAHFVLPVIFGLSYQMMFNSALRELVRV